MDTNDRERERAVAVAEARQREIDIKADPVRAPLHDVVWLAQRIEMRQRRDPGDEQMARFDPDYEFAQANDSNYLDFLMRLLPARAAIEVSEREAQTNRQLVRWTMGLAVATIVLAIATIVLAGVALLDIWPFL
jgi:hypothetical protein